MILLQIVNFANNIIGSPHTVTEMVYKYQVLKGLPESLAAFPGGHSFTAHQNDQPVVVSSVLNRSVKKGSVSSIAWTVDIEKCITLYTALVKKFADVMQPGFGALGGLPRICGVNTPQIFVKTPGAM